MSISLVILKIEVGLESPLLPHLGYVSAKSLRDDQNVQGKKFDSELTKEEIAELKRECRGCRELHDIEIETVEILSGDSVMASNDGTKHGGVDDDYTKSAVKSGGVEMLDVQVKDSSKEDTPESISGLSTRYSRQESSPVSSDISSASERSSKGGPLPSSIPFYSGNHFVEVTKGVLHLYKENQQTPLGEAERSEMLCMIAVPAAMTLHDLLQFIAPVSADIEHIRVIRDSKPNLYMVLLKFRNQKATDEFYVNFNGVRFNSIEQELCHLVYVARVEMVKESEDACFPLSGHTELPTCPVCLERMDESVEGILTILCNHSFHDGCLAKWGDTSCPVCRYCQTPELVPDNRCFGCGSQDSLWICLICGHVGCGRYVEGHAYKHYTKTEHTYAMQLGNNSVWDYTGDNYVHRLIQNKTDGKLVELESSRVENDEKLDSVQLEYTYLLTSQLEKQRRYFEDYIDMVQKDNNKQIDELKEKTQIAVEERKDLEKKLSQVTKDKDGLRKKVEQLTSQMNKLKAELQEEKDINSCLHENQVGWQKKLKDTEKQLKEFQDSKEKEVKDLQEQIRDLMFYLDAKEKISSAPDEMRNELQEGTIVVGASSSSSANVASGGHKHRKKKR